MSLENGVGMTGIKYGVGEELRETWGCKRRERGWGRLWTDIPCYFSSNICSLFFHDSQGLLELRNAPLHLALSKLKNKKFKKSKHTELYNTIKQVVLVE
jgi:hypothetical protein